MLEGVLSTPPFGLYLIVLSHHNKFLHGSRTMFSFEYFRKIALPICLRKTTKGRDSSPLSLLIRYNTHAPWITTSTIQTNKKHNHFFIWIPILGQVLVHSVDKTHVLVVAEGLMWLLFLNIFFQSFVQTPNKSLRFARFRRSYVNRTTVVLTNHCQNYTAFLLDVRCWK